MRKLFFTIVKALGLGTGLMYLLDPEWDHETPHKFRRHALEAAVVVGDEADKLLTTAGHKLAEQGCQICEQIKHAVTGNGRHHDEPAGTSAPESVAAVEAANDAKAEAACCPFTNERLLTGIGGSVLVAYGLHSRSPFALLATALGVGLVAKAIVRERKNYRPPRQIETSPARRHTIR